MSDSVTPTSFEEVAAELRAAAAAGREVRIVGAGTKLVLTAAAAQAGPALVLRTAGLRQPIEHHPDDRVAVISAGVSLARARSEIAAAGQLLALDPPLGLGGLEQATLGGVIATADAGPISHRYGGAREQLTGIVVALADGTLVRAGGRTPRSVAGYDLASLYTGSFGTLGVILAVCLRLHRLPEATATALGTASDPSALVAAARRLYAAMPELQALDLAWRGGRGGLLAQAAGEQPTGAASRAARAMAAAGLRGLEVIDDDSRLWARQRAGQRSAAQALVRVATRCSQLPAVLTLADACDATVIARAARGICYVELEPERIGTLVGGLPAGARAAILDLPAGTVLDDGRQRDADAGALELTRAVKAALDPAGTYATPFVTQM